MPYYCMALNVAKTSFIWDTGKETLNKRRHGLDFKEASEVFLDPNRVIAVDEAHSQTEERFFCIGKVGKRVATVRFTYRGGKIRIIGAGFWRKGRKFYEESTKKTS